MRPGRPSSTALVVAAGLVRRAADPRTAGCVPGGYEDHALAALRRAGPWWRILGALARARSAGPALDMIEAALLPGLSLHHCLRKRWILDALRQHDSLRCAVILGAGFDALGRSLALGGWDVLEIDHPATAAVKRGTGSLPRALAADLSVDDSWVEAFDSTRPVAVVAEGVLMYLDLERVRSILTLLAAKLAPGSLLMLTYMQPNARGLPAFRGQAAAVSTWLRQRGETFRWCLRPGEMASMLAGCGFEVIQHRCGSELLRCYAPGSRMQTAVGENLVLARRI